MYPAPPGVLGPEPYVVRGTNFTTPAYNNEPLIICVKYLTSGVNPEPTVIQGHPPKQTYCTILTSQPAFQTTLLTINSQLYVRSTTPSIKALHNLIFIPYYLTIRSNS